MNDTPTPRPRFYCHLVRLWSSGAATGLAGRHAESCADCRQFFQASTELESALRRDAARCAPPVPVGLERRIVQAIRDSHPAPVSSRSHPGWFAAAGAAAAALVALAVVIQHPPAQVKPAGVVAEIPATETAGPDESISTWLFNHVVPPAGTLVADNPLQHELNSVYSDAHSALDFLALNFLPAPAGGPGSRAGETGAKG